MKKIWTCVYLLAFLCRSAQAGSFTDFGNVYTLVSDFVIEGVDGSGNKIYDFALTINTSASTLSGFIKSVAIGTGGLNVVGAPELDVAPGGTGAWTIHTGGENAGGCDGHGAFFCSQANDFMLNPVPAGIYTWIFDVHINGALVDPSSSHVKTLYVNSTGHNIGQTSIDTTIDFRIPQQVVPEPGSVVLLGSAIGSLGLLRRRVFRIRSA